MPVIFFDIGGTLATSRLDANGRLLGFTVLPGVIAALETLRERSLPMGIISNRGNVPPENVKRELDASGLLAFFDPSLIIFAMKDSPVPFKAAADAAGVSPTECIFVGENNEERTHALNAGFASAIPLPSQVVPVLDGDALVFASLTRATEKRRGLERDAWSTAFGDAALVPLRVAIHPYPRVEVIATTSSVKSLRDAGFAVEIRGKENDPQTSDLYLVRDDRSVPKGFTSPEAFSANFLAEAGFGHLIVGSTDRRIFIALPGSVSIEDLHFPSPLHGHNERLVPDRSLLKSFMTTAVTSETSFAEGELAVKLDPKELEVLGEITAASLRQLHLRYIGVAPLTSSDDPVVSRHIAHADNKRVTDALVGHFAELGGAGTVVSRHPFKYAGFRLETVEAELPGEKAGAFILVSAHLDSTAKGGAGFNPATDPAPGSDDDASGMAAVLAATRAFASLSKFKKPKRSVRFVLFNAEEQGLEGSKFYAIAQAAEEVDIAAVFQMDMIGFRIQPTEPARNFEVHAGYTFNREVEKRSLALAQLINDVVPQVAPNLNAPQIYPILEGDFDPADGYSDHTSFQERGHAACVVSEDFFAGPLPKSPEAQPNPNYHKGTDTEINYEYAADIARVVTAAAWIAANT